MRGHSGHRERHPARPEDRPSAESGHPESLSKNCFAITRGSAGASSLAGHIRSLDRVTPLDILRRHSIHHMETRARPRSLSVLVLDVASVLAAPTGAAAAAAPPIPRRRPRRREIPRRQRRSPRAGPPSRPPRTPNRSRSSPALPSTPTYVTADGPEHTQVQQVDLDRGSVGVDNVESHDPSSIRPTSRRRRWGTPRLRAAGARPAGPAHHRPAAARPAGPVRAHRTVNASGNVSVTGQYVNVDAQHAGRLGQRPVGHCDDAGPAPTQAQGPRARPPQGSSGCSGAQRRRSRRRRTWPETPRPRA